MELVTIEDNNKRLFYQQMGIAEHWSVRDLRDKQDEMLYERSLIAVKPEDKIVKTLEKVTPTHMEPDVVLRNSYVLDFLGLSGYYSEEELENAIAKQLEAFILELGQGFAFLERQKRFTIDGTDYKLDLLFYHRKLKCLVAIDLLCCAQHNKSQTGNVRKRPFPSTCPTNGIVGLRIPSMLIRPALVLSALAISD